MPGDWARLHPLSPLLRGSRAVMGLAVVLGSRSLAGGTSQNHGLGLWIDAAVIPLVILGGLVSWLVTRWRVHGAELQIDTGLFRRQSVRVPLSRVQTIDVVRPLLARALGLSELRVEVAGRGTGHSRLAYLTEDHATAVRAQLLALAHGLHERTPEPPERPVLAVHNGRLVGAAGMTAACFLLPIGIAAVAAVATGNGVLVATVFGAFGPVLLGIGLVQARRFNAEFSFALAEAPDGLRIRSGLLATRAATIPYGRVQAVRWIQPVLWRPFGWVRLEVDVARQREARRGSENDSAEVTRALLPVGTPTDAHWLLSRVLPGASVVPPAHARAPRRARLRAPLSFWALRAWYDEHHAVGRTGRVRLTTVVVPLEKVQSIRWAQGPVERWLRLATVHVDTAGRGWQAVARCRDAEEAAATLERLTDLARAARVSRLTVDLSKK